MVQEGPKLSLQRLRAEDIAPQWEALKVAIATSLSPLIQVTEEKMANVLSMLLAEELVCWVLVRDEDVVALCTVTVHTDYISQERTLVIYSLTALRPVTDVQWAWAFMELRKYAKVQKCWRITAQTKEERLVRLVRQLGGKADLRLVELEV